MKRKIVAIGGGRVVHPRGRVPQTLSIDREIVRLTGKKSPRLLFVPTASTDDEGYCEAIERLYSGELGCRHDTLLLYRDRPDRKRIREKIINSDIIYIGGGNTLKMMQLWRSLGVDKYLDLARKNGAVLCGLSAGAICWFRQGNSDSRKFSNEKDRSLIKVKGLGFVNTLVCPHYDVEKHRQPSLKKMMKNTPGMAIALDNCAAIEIIDDRYRILTSAERKNAYRIYWHRGEYYRQPLNKDGRFRKLSELLDKRA